MALVTGSLGVTELMMILGSYRESGVYLFITEGLSCLLSEWCCSSTAVTKVLWQPCVMIKHCANCPWPGDCFMVIHPSPALMQIKKSF